MLQQVNSTPLIAAEKHNRRATDGQRPPVQTQVTSPLPLPTQIGKYRFMSVISRGGFSIVYLAQDEKSGEAVAIKEYLPSLLARRAAGDLVPAIPKESEELFRVGMKCFFDEARTLATIHHHNIVRVLDFFRANETVYMVMRYESGRSLEEHVRRGRSHGQIDVMSEGFIRRVFGQVMTGLHEVHTQRVLHLDIKPANVYLKMNGAPVLLDFGAARQTLQRDLNHSYPMYTPGFAAPELYHDDAEIGPWTDMYSVGASIFACMSGKPLQESAARRSDDKIPKELQAFRGLYSNELIRIAERCLALNSLERPQSALEVQGQLQRAPARQEANFLENLRQRFLGRGK